jgi:hypothetical protein
MNIDVNKKYFLMSFRFDKTKPEDFGLVQSSDNEKLYINKLDNSEWFKYELYDFGWGNECGFMRLPELEFSELKYLLENSKVQENRYGAAYVLEKNYPDNLLNYLLTIFKNTNLLIDESLKEIIKILGLDKVKNRSSIIGKNYEQINNDFENWKYISKRALEFINMS